MNTPRIAIADDHRLVRDGIIRLLNSLNYTVQFDCENGKEIVEYCSKNPVDIVLMDINMSQLDGIAATARLREQCPEVKVIALSMMNDDLTLMRMMKAGAKSYVLKDAPPGELEKAINGVFEHGYYYSPFLSGRLINSLGVAHEENVEEVLSYLNNREIEFLKHTCSALTYKEIASIMCVSPRSIDGYRDSLFDKLNARSRVELAIFAIKHNLVRI